MSDQVQPGSQESAPNAFARNAAIHRGLSDAEAHQAGLAAELEAVWGAGNPVGIQTGVGSKGNETVSHFQALRRAERVGNEPPGTYNKAVAEIWKRDPKRAAALGLPQQQRAGA